MRERAGIMSNGIRQSSENIGQSCLTYIHPAWYSFIKYCETLKYGEVDKLKIQDGLPMLAEEGKEKSSLCANGNVSVSLNNPG